MTPNELRVRCKQFISVNSAHGRIVLTDGFNARLESLCREMIAEGLRMAEVQTRKLTEDINTTYEDACFQLLDWLPDEAQRVKENHDTKKAGQI